RINRRCLLMPSKSRPSADATSVAVRGVPSASNWMMGQRILLPRAKNTAMGLNWFEDSAATGAAEVESFMDAKLNLVHAVRKRNVGAIWRINTPPSFNHGANSRVIAPKSSVHEAKSLYFVEDLMKTGDSGLHLGPHQTWVTGL